MKRLDQAGISSVVVSLVLVSLLLAGALGFGGWAFSSRQDYKNNVDQKINAAVAVAKDQQSKADTIKFNEAAKNPLRTYQGPEAYGSLIVAYPKTWSAYVDDSGKGQALVDGYFDPSTVPSISDQSSVFALRVQVLQQSYAQTAQNLQSQNDPQHPTTFTAYALPKLPKVVGLKVVGQLTSQVSGTMVVLPLRSNTLEISTQGSQYLNDFNNYILPNFTFSP